jgi:branched-chain amino acid transport system permease protein
MSNVVLFALLGLGQGALIAGLSLGLVVSYRGGGVINLATGATAMIGGYAFWALTSGKFATLATVPALILTAVIVAIFGVLMETLAFRPLRTASPLARLAASLGVLLTTQAAVVLAFGTSPQSEPSILPNSTISVFGQDIPVDRFILAGAVLLVTLCLATTYRKSRFGLATRAAAEDQTSAVLFGLPPNRLSLINTVIASLIAGIFGVLAAPLLQLDSITLPLQVVPALAAALFARFTSFWVACTAGLLIGVAESLVTYASSLSWFPTAQGAAMPGVVELLVFLTVLIAVWLRGAKLPGRGEIAEPRLPEAPPARNPVRWASISLAVGAVAVILFPYDFRQALINSMIGAILALSVVIITGYLGQISVVQLALAGTAGFILSRLTVSAGIGFPLAPLLAAIGATVLGLLMAVPALRIRGVMLAVVTLAAAVAIENFGFSNPTWGGGVSGSPVPQPHLFGLNLGTTAPFRGIDGKLPSAVFGFVVLVVAVVVGLLVANLRRSTLGQQMLAVRSNERAAAAAGIEVRNVKLAGFAISAFIAGVAGTLYGYDFGSISATGFDVFTALALIAYVYVGGVTMVSGAVFAGAVTTAGLFPYALYRWFGLSGTWALLFGGVTLVLTLATNPEGVAGAIYKRRHERRRSGVPTGDAKSPEARESAEGPSPETIRR